MTRHIAVIGANYGDEGKGQTVHGLVSELSRNQMTISVVKHNGGAQAAHHVTTDTDVYCFSQMPSFIWEEHNRHLIEAYYAQDYMINPIHFIQEMNDTGHESFFFNPNVRITTPLDKMVGTIMTRDHGTTGHGIIATVRRSLVAPVKMQMGLESSQALYEYSTVHDYYREMFRDDQEALKDLGDMYDSTLDAFVNAYSYFTGDIAYDQSFVIGVAGGVIYEGCQGMLLDQNRLDLMPHLTPSNTTSRNPKGIHRRAMEHQIKKEKTPLELLYVSRCYMTRHGNGPLPYETKTMKRQASEHNQKNDHQGEFRFAPMVLSDVIARCKEDAGDTTRYPTSILFTCMDAFDEFDGLDVILKPFEDPVKIHNKEFMDIATEMCEQRGIKAYFRLHAHDTQFFTAAGVPFIE